MASITHTGMFTPDIVNIIMLTDMAITTNTAMAITDTVIIEYTMVINMVTNTGEMRMSINRSTVLAHTPVITMPRIEIAMIIIMIEATPVIAWYPGRQSFGRYMQAASGKYNQH